jgi:D-methionine transport system substrate-binding protein
MKKKIVFIALVLALAAGAFAGCNNATEGDGAGSDEPAATEEPAASEDTSGDTAEAVTLKVGATPTPHAEILNQVVEDLAASGITLEVEEFTDYVLPNTALDSGDLGANYFQHQPYLDQFNEENGTKLVGVAPIHYEPLGLYPGKTATVDELKDGAQIAVPNDATNEARALLLLQDIGLITLKEGAGLEATKNDIETNDKNLDIVEVEAAQLPKTLADVDLAVINGNYAIEAGLNAATDALAKEEKDSLAATTYANLIVVKEGDETKPEIQALVTALQSDKVRAFIEETYGGAVVPSF